jgi:hypothetical protein
MTPSNGESGHLLNHVELFHRPGERELAVQFFQTLQCTIDDVTKDFGASSTYLCVYPGPRHPDPLNNVVYLSEMRQPQPLEALLAQRAQDDPELRAALDDYALLRSKNGRVMHFGLRYPDFEALRKVIDHLEHRLPAELEGRVTVHPPYPAKLPALGADVLQGFVHTDVIGTGLYPFGQLIELQAEQPLEPSPSN